MRPSLLTLALVALAGCDALGDPDPFDRPTYDVYEVALDVGVDQGGLAGRIGLELYRSDVASPDGEPNRGGGYYGRWELDDPDDRFPEGEGSVRGGLDRDGRTFRLSLFKGLVAGDVDDEGVLYELEGTVEDGQISGTWDRLGSYPEGALSGRLVRPATETVRVP